MKKKAFIFTLAGALLFGGGVHAGTIIDSYKTNRPGQIATVELETVHKGRIGLISGGRQVAEHTWYADGVTYVPLRQATELLGADLIYDTKTQTATLKKTVEFCAKPK